jgi:DNA-binding response OmpR family regulator
MGEYDRIKIPRRKNAGRIISRDELLSKVLKCQQTMTTRAVDQTISSLRRKLGDDAESPRYLITVYGVGYTLGTFTSYAPESRKTARALR